jgi:4-amino-4-deoxy-L-arabinose transferase-like glycosyltransferase
MKLGWREQIRKLIPLKRIPYSNYILLAILILGFVIRVYKIDSLPLYGDELTIVYDSYSVLKTGVDQTGEFLPLTFKMGAGRPAGYVYGSIPFVYLFGPSVWGVRGLSLASGMGIIILMYFLGKKMFNEKVGLMSSLLASASLWNIYLSRAGFEAHFALFLTLFGVVMFLYKKYILMAILFGLAIFTYPTFKLTIPLLFLILIFFEGFRKVFSQKLFLVSLFILALFAGVSIRQTLSSSSEERFLRLNIFSDNSLQESIIQKINEQRNISTLPIKIKPLIYNRPLAYTRILFENFIENLSPQFLYLRGDRNPRHNPGEWGMLYLIEFPLLLIGLYYLAKNSKRNLLLIIACILIVPLATMFMGQTHALRNNLMLPAFILISAYALTNISTKARIFIFSLFGIQLIYVLSTIYFFAPNKFGSFWSLKAKTASLEAINADKNQQIILSTKIDNIEYAYPVYAKIDPREVISQYGKYPKVYGNVVITDGLTR